jgi:hypothetical protein
LELNDAELKELGFKMGPLAAIRKLRENLNSSSLDSSQPSHSLSGMVVPGGRGSSTPNGKINNDDQKLPSQSTLSDASLDSNNNPTNDKKEMCMQKSNHALDLYVNILYSI